MSTSMDSVAPPAPTKSSIISGAKTLWQWLGDISAWIKTLSPRGVASYGASVKVSLSDTSNFALYSSTSLFMAKRQGKIVNVFGTLACTKDGYITGITRRIFANLPQEFQPSYSQYMLMHGGDGDTWLLTVLPNGEISASRYSGPQVAGVFLPFSITYITN